MSEFLPKNNPNCINDNKCPETIDNILTYLQQEQYCGCVYESAKVSIGISIKKIPKYAFYGAKIKEVHLHHDICLIDEGAFAESNIKIDLQELANIKAIGKGAFYRSRCFIKSIIIPNSVTSIGESCFEDCYKLKSISIPNSVTSIGKSCFEGCYKLTSISIPNTVRSIGEFCFTSCIQLKYISIPNSVTSIGKSCFQNCQSFTSISIPDSVISIDYNCFSYCASLNTISIGNGLKYINKEMFISSITIEISDDNPYFCKHEGILYNKNKT